jgi:hypothetical protein
MSERTIRLIHRVSTGVLAALLAALTIAYFTVPYFAEGNLHLGFPDWFRYALGAGKALGAIALVANVSPRMKTLAYDGLAIMFVCAAIAHPMAGDPPATALGGVFAMTLLVASCLTATKPSATAGPTVLHAGQHAA